MAVPLRADNIDELRVKARSGDAGDRIELATALIYSLGGGSLVNLREAKQILGREAEAGSSEAQYQLGRLLISAKITYEEASKIALAKVQPEFDKAKAERDEEGVTAASFAYMAYLDKSQKKLSGQEERDRVEGMSWLRAAMAQGNEKAALKLASTLSQDEENPAQFQEGKNLYNKLAEQGNPAALLVIAEDHMKSGEKQEAEKVYRALAIKGNERGMKNLADLLLEPDRTPKEMAEATDLLRKVVESGNRYDDQRTFLFHLLRENALPAEEKEGLELLVDYAGTKELDWAQDLFVKRLEEGKSLPEKAAPIRDLYQAARAGEVRAANLVGQGFLYGILPFPQDHWAAVKILEDVAYKKKDVEAMLLLGTAYSFDSLTTFEAERFFSKAANLGSPELAELYAQATLHKNPEAMRLLALLRLRKNPLLGSNNHASFYWADKAAHLGDARAQVILSNLYFNKKNNPIEGLAWKITSATKLKWADPDRDARKYEMSTEQIAEAEKLAGKYKTFSSDADFYKRMRPIRQDWFKLGNEHREKEGEEHLAILAYHHASRLSPGQTYILVELGKLYWKTEDKGIAIELMEQAIKNEPENLSGLYNLGFYYKQVKLKEEARKTWTRLLGILYNPANNYDYPKMVAYVEKGLAELSQATATIVDKKPEKVIKSTKKDGSNADSYTSNQNNTPTRSTAKTNPINGYGVVTEILEANDYTYMSLDTGTKKIWVAGPKKPVKIGDEIYISKGQSIQNFDSKSLGRTFNTILFMESIKY